MSMDLSLLPDEVLEQLLQHLGQSDRLGTCALVQRRWQVAAIAASKNLKLLTLSSHDIADLLQWVHKYGQHITSLHIRYDRYDDTIWLTKPLPCPQLQELRLSSFALQLAPAAAAAAAAAAAGSDQGLLGNLTRLTSLTLTDCEVLSGVDSLTSLSVLTGLQSLRLELMTVPGRGGVDVPCSLLSQLTQLTFLSLHGSCAEPTLQHLSCLTQLQGMLLGFKQPWSIAAATGLVQLTQLTMLRLTNAGSSGSSSTDGTTTSSSTTNVLSQITSLRFLALDSFKGLQPAVLAPLKQLTQLNLYHTTDTADATELLRALGQLQQLKHLGLSGQLKLADDVAPAAAAAYSGLTASSVLQHLDLTYCGLPSGAWQYIFPSERQLPELHVLILNFMQSSTDCQMSSAQMSSADLERLCSSCPNLQQLSVRGAVVQPGMDLAPIQQLSALQTLSVSGVTNESAGDIAELTGLTYLDLDQPCNLDHMGLVLLLHLRQLQCLHIAGDEGHLTLRNTAGQDPPDVWEKLFSHCIRDDRVLMTAAMLALGQEDRARALVQQTLLSALGDDEFEDEYEDEVEDGDREDEVEGGVREVQSEDGDREDEVEDESRENMDGPSCQVQ